MNIVGRFRSGHLVDGKPVSLAEWRVTTGDPDVAEKIHALLGGESPTEWEAPGEDNIEVFTEAPEVSIILEGPNALRQVMVLYGARRHDLPSSEPTIVLFFRLADDPELGLFKFQSASWSMLVDLTEADVETRIADIADGGAKVAATLGIEEVSFAKSGPRAGQLVTYKKPVLTITGAA